jgi:hypothetical protein
MRDIDTGTHFILSATKYARTAAPREKLRVLVDIIHEVKHIRRTVIHQRAFAD